MSTLPTIFSAHHSPDLWRDVCFGLSHVPHVVHGRDNPSLDGRIGNDKYSSLAKEDAYWWARRTGLLFLLGVVGVVLASVIPTERTIYALIAWELAQNVEGLKELPVEFLDYIRALLKSELLELTKGVPK